MDCCLLESFAFIMDLVSSSLACTSNEKYPETILQQSRQVTEKEAKGTSMPFWPSRQDPTEAVFRNAMQLSTAFDVGNLSHA